MMEFRRDWRDDVVDEGATTSSQSQYSIISGYQLTIIGHLTRQVQILGQVRQLEETRQPKNCDKPLTRITDIVLHSIVQCNFYQLI